MSLDQFIGACLGLVLIMLARLLDRWLPATETAATAPVALPPVSEPTGPPPGASTGDTGASAAPSSGELDMVPDDEAEPPL